MVSFYITFIVVEGVWCEAAFLCMRFRSSRRKVVEGAFEVGVTWELVSSEAVFVARRFWFRGRFGALIITSLVSYLVANSDAWG